MRRLAPSLFLSILLPSCTETVMDTEGRAYKTECREGVCELSLENGDSKQTFRVDARGSLLSVCPSAAEDFACRPVTCGSSSVCVTLGGDEFACSGRRCVANDRPMTPEDRVGACLAGTGAYQGTPEQLARITMARACTGSCTLPAVCTARE